ncbi:hypothetical protein DYD21_14310 [Rhodohalobacter sp. SW132]|uniref:hypothetical protein n=1 Tax=Rhodohalobacter sp. SW132 TaxID=2293433 RepID=UPI000E252053|nr:hypothetical protein [Rhodohalobacter sp. SW132]REL32985.1 hypothetical protein DYD21_14310 [Rhodohalobacter sp. SW132]
MNIWRVNIKPASSEGIDPRSFCITRDILGIGWGIETDSETVTWDEYYSNANSLYRLKLNYKGWWPALNALKNRIAEDDLCWTRDLDGIYYLGRITNPYWYYSNKPEFKKADVVNIRDCKWYKVGQVDSVPGTIVNRFTRGRTVEKVGDKNGTLREFSKYLFNTISNVQYYRIKQVEADFYSLIHSDDCEDIIGLYLQSKGYYMIPSSCKKSTVNFEYVLKHKEDGHKAVAQVKKGKVDLNFNNYSELDAKVYLFTTKGKYLGKPSSNISVIEKEVLQDFVDKNYEILPNKIQTWLGIHNHLKKT